MSRTILTPRRPARDGRTISLIPMLRVLVACGLLATAEAHAIGATEDVLHTFKVSAPKGGNPSSGVIRDAAGNLYGTAGGGNSGQGVIYKVDPTGRETVLYNFTGGADGGQPDSALIADSAGNLYGTAPVGGTSGQGVVYKLDASGQFTVLHSFTGADGGQPNSALITDSAGNLYGTASIGGTFLSGVVYKLDRSGQLTVLYNFTGGADGGQPYSPLTADSEGDLYGTASVGGTGRGGVVYKLAPSGQETVIYNFTNGTDGGFPYGAVVRDAAGDLYGTTELGGTGGFCGVVFKVDGHGYETVLHSFTCGTDGGGPTGVIADSEDNLYGTAAAGGDLNSSVCPGYGCGVVYRINKSANETVLYNFLGGTDGSTPGAGVIRDPAGNLYGTTFYGGSPASLGTVFKLNPTGHENQLCVFASPSNGSLPDSGVILDPSGDLFGTTVSGGALNSGVVFRLDATGKETVLYTFTGGADGREPHGVIRDAAGNLYGTTYNSGPGFGVVYKLDTSGQQTVLYMFPGGTDGSFPTGLLTLDEAGNLYGTAQLGGSVNDGIIYKIDPSGAETIFYSFIGGANGFFPSGGVVLDPEGNLYGTTLFGGTGAGVVFKVDHSGKESVLYTFSGGADGGVPYGGVIRDAAGNLYGTTSSGGSGSGVVYKLNPSGKETVLHTFEGGTDGSQPFTGVIRDAAGNLYGTTPSGGAANAGVLFKIDPSGKETILLSFSGGADGNQPSGVVRDLSGNFFGTMTNGGNQSGGLVFKITP